MRRCKLYFLFCVAPLVFAAVPLAVMLPLMAHLDPEFLGRLDAAALSVLRRMPAGWVSETVVSSYPASGADQSHAFQVGYVFKHRKKRFTGAITQLTPADQRDEHSLSRDDIWYSALIDQRYEKISTGEVFVAESQIERMYPGSEDGFKHPLKKRFFRGFDPEESSFLPKSRDKKKRKKKKNPKKRKKAQKKPKDDL